jgi:hypothetical protein
MFLLVPLEAAIGVLKALSLGEILNGNAPAGGELSSKFSKHRTDEMLYSVIWNTEDRFTSKDGPIDLMSKQELWLAKLGLWSEALVFYQEKLENDPSDFEAMLGCMECLDASGEWRDVTELFQGHLPTMTVPSSPGKLQLREDIAPRSKRKALQMCANAAWRLGQWDDLEKYSLELVRGLTAPPHLGDSQHQQYAPVYGPREDSLDFDGAFFSAILRVHRREWAEAADAIDGARKAMDGRLTALMAESYNRAYPSMVTAQTLAELEEIVEFRKLEERSRFGAHQHQVNRPNESLAREQLLSVWRDRLAGCRVDADVHASILAVRSLVLGPADEIEATIKLSTLSRQAQRPKFAEGVLLRPLSALTNNLDGFAFGFGLSEFVGTRVDLTAFDGPSLLSVIDRVLASDLSHIVPFYGPNHQQLSKNLVEEAGGLDR